MSSNKVQQLEALPLSFPSLRCCVPARLFRPWDAIRFAQYCVPMSSGEKEAALFVLSVWSSSDDWSEFGLVCAPEDDANRGRFDMHRALSRGDDEHMRAFAAWVAAPWWC
jgi:hypothetical protein